MPGLRRRASSLSSWEKRSTSARAGKSAPGNTLSAAFWPESRWAHSYTEPIDPEPISRSSR